MSTCHAPIDTKAKARMTVTRARAPKKAAWHAKITKKSSGISQAVRRKNQAMIKGKRR
jgi:GTP cyclohydrolase III